MRNYEHMLDHFTKEDRIELDKLARFLQEKAPEVSLVTIEEDSHIVSFIIPDNVDDDKYYDMLFQWNDKYVLITLDFYLLSEVRKDDLFYVKDLLLPT